jgi:glycosyltransferase involved in cell wall biosynthesis
VLTLATPENIEAVGEAGIPYTDEKDLEEKLQRVLRDGALVNSYRQRAQKRVREHYDWERIVDRYENLFAQMTGRPPLHETGFAPEALESIGEASVRKS